VGYQVAIPSYSRPNFIVNATLATLAKYGASSKLITVFVANDEEYRDYRREMPPGIDLVVAELGLLKCRRWYSSQYYDKGTPLVNLDDDITGIVQKNGVGLLPYDGSFDEIAETGFRFAEKYGSKLWAVNPVTNGFYMRDEVTVGLRFACGLFFGNYAGNVATVGNDRPSLYSSGEDWETTIRSFLMEGPIVRLEWLAGVQKKWSTGGMMTELAHRESDNAKRLAEIVARYPDLAAIKIKAGGVPSLRLKSITYAREPKP
jgi:hypothetical protein